MDSRLVICAEVADPNAKKLEFQGDLADSLFQRNRVPSLDLEAKFINLGLQALKSWFGWLKVMWHFTPPLLVVKVVRAYTSLRLRTGQSE